eukprot:357930-Chlamydomonas_euryale.AAC.10
MPMLSSLNTIVKICQSRQVFLYDLAMQMRRQALKAWHDAAQKRGRYHNVNSVSELRGRCPRTPARGLPAPGPRSVSAIRVSTISRAFNLSHIDFSMLKIWQHQRWTFTSLIFGWVAGMPDESVVQQLLLLLKSWWDWVEWQATLHVAEWGFGSSTPARFSRPGWRGWCGVAQVRAQWRSLCESAQPPAWSPLSC